MLDIRERTLFAARLWGALVIAGPVLIALAIASWWYDSAHGPRGAHGPSLVSPVAIAVSRREEIFVFAEWGRIRVFDRAGVELRSWRIDAGLGVAALAFDPNDVLHVATARNDTDYAFDAFGRLLSKSRDSDAFERIASSRGSALGPAGESYTIRGNGVIRTSNAGDVVVVPPSPPWVVLRAVQRLTIGALGCLAPLVGIALRRAPGLTPDPT